MGPQAFRDGIFSDSDPMARYGTLQTAYSDGSLGLTQKLTAAQFRSLGPKQRAIYLCRSQCNKFTDARRARCSRRCVKAPRITMRQLLRQGPNWGRTMTKSTAGLGELDSTTMTVAGIGVAIVAGLLLVGSTKSKR